MKKELKDWFVPWLFTSREYNVGILDKAWANPDHARLMLNENPIGPSEKVIEAAMNTGMLPPWATTLVNTTPSSESSTAACDKSA